MVDQGSGSTPKGPSQTPETCLYEQLYSDYTLLVENQSTCSGRETPFIIVTEACLLYKEVISLSIQGHFM